MQITLVSSGDTVSDVWDLISIINYIETAFDIEFFSFCEQRNTCVESIAQDLSKLSIHRLKEMTDSLSRWFVTSSFPRRNSKISLSCWISEVFLHIYTPVQVSAAEDTPMIVEKTIAAQPADTHSETDSTSGLIISFGKTLEYLPQKSVTRRTWKDVHAQKFINAFTQNKLVKAFDKDIRYGGKQIGWCRLSCAPYKERLCDMPQEDLLAEGGMCNTIGEFVQQYFDGNPRLEVWVIRFEFIHDLALAAATNPAAALGAIGIQSGDLSPDKNYWCPQCEVWMDRSGFNEVLGSDFQEQLCKVCGSEVSHEFDENSPATVDISSLEVEVLESEEKPVYTISIIVDGSFSEERVNRLPPYLIDRKGNLLKKTWHRSCDAGYSEITSQHLSNIAADSGLTIKLMADSLEVSQACICGDPPPFIVDKGGAYKRDHLKQSLAVRYAQVVSEYLSNIVVV